ncbi:MULTISPECIES: RNA polymerase sigma factor [unclassified Frigoribacterium]|uniref:RNA polymerase sigma factor n=1 Tax=unclassified Frigoribacterium TaxID=2627005 RepID=UPI0009E7A3D8|nr:MULTISPECIES: sigma-70 family RNA polymerase sigma factor [unclassified Frigoribacterium]
MEPFERVVARHGRTVWRVCRAVLDEHDTDDAWSETFVAALVAYPSLPASTNLEAWLVTIAHRKAIDVLRARDRRPRPVETVPEPPHAPPHDEAMARTDELDGALRTLPPGQRRAVVYHHLVGLSHREIAEVTGISADAARRASADGIAALRRLLAEPGTPRPTGTSGRVARRAPVPSASVPSARVPSAPVPSASPEPKGTR